MVFQISDGRLNLRVEEQFYAEAVVYKCFYWYTRDFVVEINRESDTLLVSLVPKMRKSVIIWEALVEKIKQDLIDFKLRAIVLSETSTIRELIIAKAFAYYEEENGPSSNVSDPVGFNPKS
jgi:His-Xaa-Ser system protein HxsD